MSIKNLYGHLIIKYDIGSKHAVCITHINNPHDFYIRPVLYSTFMSTIEKASTPMELHKIQLHRIVIFKMKEHRSFARGRVSSINNEDGKVTFDIYALDCGFLEKSVLSENIYHPENEDVASIPPLSLHCQLDLCYPIGGVFNERAINSMKDLLENGHGTAEIKEIIEDKYIVHLNNHLGDIATHMALMGCSFFVPRYTTNTVQTQKAIPEYQFKYKQFNVGDVLRVRVQSGDSLNGFFVAEKNDYTIFMKERVDLNNYYRYKNKILPQEMKEGKAICTYIDFNYERAVIKQVTIPENKALVQLIDWGTILEVPVSNMIPAPGAATVKPALAIYCSTEESQTWNNRLGRFLYPGYEFNITIKQVGNNFSTPNVVDLSRVCGF